MTITTTDPTHFLLTTDPTKVGTASITVQLTAGSAAIPAFYIEGKGFTGSGRDYRHAECQGCGLQRWNCHDESLSNGFDFLQSSTLSTTSNPVHLS